MNSKESLKVRSAYGVSTGPVIVAVQSNRFSGVDGKAEIPGVGCIIRFINSVWSLILVNKVIDGMDREVPLPLIDALCIMSTTD